MKPGSRLSKMRHLPEARGQTQLWQTMRVRRKQGAPWTRSDLEALCAGALTRGAMNLYLRTLVRVGYVANSNAGVFRLVRDTGPLAPRALKGDAARIYDPNVDQVVKACGARGAESSEDRP